MKAIIFAVLGKPTVILEENCRIKLIPQSNKKLFLNSGIA
jgi:hypothetical protein